MVILSIDYGDARTGVAACDKMQLLSSPVCVIKESDAKKLAERISTIAVEKKAERIIVGLPLNMDGSEGERAEKCRLLAAEIFELTSIETIMVDERLTTVEAHERMNELNIRGKKRKEIIDAVSACIILEDYLGSVNRQNI